MSMFKNIGIAAGLSGGLRDVVTPLSKPASERGLGDNIFIERERGKGLVVLDDQTTYPKRTDSGWW